MTGKPTVLDSTAKETLRKVVRGLRTKLVDELSDAAEGEYQLAVDATKARLREAQRCRRERLEAWIDEQRRTTEKKGSPKAETEIRRRYLRQAVQEAAHTLLHRLVLLRILEHHSLLSPAVITGGWKSPAYADEFQHFAGPLKTDSTLGYQRLLEVVFAELSLELPGLFGPVGLTDLFPVPAATLRDLVTALNDPALETAWGDDTTLGWVYQYWNDPDREALDKKIADGGKIEPHEIAQKTQMFTERYMVEWLLENSLGLTWLAMCKKNGWVAEAEAVLPVLEERRADWRKKREAKEVAEDALMPIHGPLEAAWKYYVPQPIPADAVEKAPASIRDLKLLDPACGSGHFLVSAFDLLARLYQEEARHRGVSWSADDIAESILGENLYGIDIDPRAIQIAAAALWLKAKLYAPAAQLGRLNLVAPVLRLARLPETDAALETLRTDLEAEVGLPKPLTTKLVKALAGVDYLGTLLRVDRAVEGALQEIDGEYDQAKGWQGDLYEGFRQQQISGSLAEAKVTVLEKLERFLEQHSGSEDLGVRLSGEQLAAGVRFVRMAREGTYDIVVGNPPYQGLSKTAQFEYVTKQYPRGKADLYAAFLERGLELVREGGISALLTMRGWMFLGQFKELRMHVLKTYDLRCIGDFDRGAFDEVPNEVLAVSAPIIRRATGVTDASVAILPTPFNDTSYDRQRTNRKRATVLAQVGRHEFDPKGFAVIEGEPIVYWWTKEFLDRYAKAPKLGDLAPARFGLTTGDNERFTRLWHEPQIRAATDLSSGSSSVNRWAPFVLGGQGRTWLESLRDVILWQDNGICVKEKCIHQYGTLSKQVRNEEEYFKIGVAINTIGSRFGARLFRTRSIFSNAASSIFSKDNAATLCLLNSATSRSVLESLNPTVNFQVGDVNRVPHVIPSSCDKIVHTLTGAFDSHEASREGSIEFVRSGVSAWRYAQDWAQRAVDRADGEPLPPYEPVYDPPAPEAHLSFAIGVALGRFGANGEGIVDAPPADALPAGILFVGPGDETPDSLDTPRAARILAAWDEHQTAILQGKRGSLRDYLRKDFFAYHKSLYENRPIYFPLSSEKRTFVAWISIHRWNDQTLQTLLAEHLVPIMRKLDAEIADLSVARASSDKKSARSAEQRFVTQKRLRDEIGTFAEGVSQCAERGAPPTDAQCKKRDADATFVMDLDDGVMINSAALWPLLAPQWADPKKWWKQLCQAEGKKDYDWAHLSKRYFPVRVDDKCKTDPSLAVAHGCFWKYHPAKAYQWELRLQDEIRPDFTIDEPDSNAHRARFLADNAPTAADLRAKEQTRRDRKAKQAEAASEDTPDADQASDDATEDES